MRQGLKIGIAVIVGAALLVGGLNVPVDRWTRGPFRSVGTLMTRAASETRQKFISFKGGDDGSEIAKMNNDLLRARLQLIRLERLQSENEELREELSFSRSVQYDTKTADIINYQPDPTRSLLRINVGSVDGIEAEMPVVAGGALIGVVQSVGKRTADVVLLGDTDFRALALVSQRGTPGVVKGQIGDGVTMEQLPQDESVQSGDIVKTSGLDGIYPRGILIGTITSVSEAPGSVFMVAQIERSVNPRQRHVVTVIRHD